MSPEYCAGCLRPVEAFRIPHEEAACAETHRPHPNRTAPRWTQADARYYRLSWQADAGRVRTWPLGKRLPRGTVPTKDEAWLRAQDQLRAREGRPIWHA